MKAAIIGASKEALHTIYRARKYGLTVLALDGDPEAAGLKAADRQMVVDISDEVAVIEALKREKPDFVLTVPIGRYLTTTGAVNDALGLPGISKEMAALCTDKFKFHEKLSSAGLRDCHCYAVSNGKIMTAEGSCAEALEEKNRAEEGEISVFSDSLKLTFPAILKPRFGSGSRGIHMISGREQLKAALDKISGEPYVLEECIPGEEYGVDGAVTKDGFQMILLRKKENTPPPARQAVGYFSILPTDKFWRQARDYMTEVIACLGLKECLLHGDIIKGENGPFAIELSARPSGHNLHNLFTPLCTGVDMMEEYIRYRMGLPYDFTPRGTKSMLIHYFDMQGKVNYVPTLEEEAQAVEARLAAWECNLKIGEELKPVSDGHSLMGRGYFVLEGDGQEFLREQAEVIKRLFC
ncbi:MAG: ATP-grasp domain-containing protein [Clostridium sp.]|nr:ATP-grasp domain-containing protein [Clostridium sp.]